ncbi:MAG: hypothetical protein R3C44_01485 [Chloroflexota bacterium]
MKQKNTTVALLAVMFIFGVLLLGPQHAEAGIFNESDEVTYKEYWVSHKEFTAGCNQDGTPQDPDGSWYVEPGPLDKCPKTLLFTLPDNFNSALKVEIFLDIWRGYDTEVARFRLNNQPTVYEPGVGSDWSRTPYVAEINKNELFQGPNSITMWGDRPFHVHDIAFRIYYDDTHPLIAGSPDSDVTPPSGQLVSIVDETATEYAPGDGGTLMVNTDQLTLNATADDDAAYVEFHAYYDGYDEDNDGEFVDWHNASRNNWWPDGKDPQVTGGTIDNIGTKKVPNGGGDVQVKWNMEHIVNQSGVKFKIRIVDDAGNVREAAGGESAEFTLARNYPVFYYTIPGFTDFGIHMDGGRPDSVAYDFDIPNSINLPSIQDVYVVGAYWNRPKFQINGSPLQSANPTTNDAWELGIVKFNYTLKNGTNTINYVYSGSQTGQFIEEPGPMFVFRGINGPDDVVAPYIISRTPTPNSTNVDTRQPIIVHMGESGSGVDPQSIVMTVNGNQVTPEISGSSVDLILTYTPTTPYPNSTQIPVTVFGCDLLGNCMISADLFSFVTEAPDVTPPVISNVKVTTTDSTALITWDTDELADSQVDYGLTTGYELGTMSDTDPVMSHSIEITGLSPDTIYNYLITSEDQDSNSANTGNLTFKTKKLPGAVQSDDFSSCTLNDEIWTYIDPVGDSTLSFTGEVMQIGVPSGVSHDIWKTGINAPRIMQSISDQDFSVVVKMDSLVSKKTQLQGVLVQQDGDNYLRFNVQHDGNDPSLAIVDGNNGNAVLLYGLPLLTIPPYLRITRLASEWTLDYSLDGVNWTNATVFTKVLTVSQIGLFAGNTGTNPAHTGVFDYFFNTASPINPEDPPNTLDINVDGVGTVSKSPDKVAYNCGEAVNVTATPAQDWTFVGWSGDLVSSNPVETYYVDKSSVITATFENTSTYTLDVNSVFVGGDAGGTIDIDPDQLEYSYNDQIQLTANPTLGWSFTGWSGDLVSQNITDTLTITKNSVITGTFSKDAYTLTVTLLNDGVGIGGSVETTPVKPTYEYGDEVTLEATAAEGWDFIGWEGDVDSTDETITIEMTANTEAIAHFRQQQQVLTTNIVSNPAPGGTGSGGVILKDPDKATYGYGESVELKAAPYGGWVFDGWSGALSGTNITETLVITTDLSVTATFHQETYTLNVTSTGPGEVIVDPVKDEYFFDDIVTLTAVPDSDLYELEGWGGDLLGTGNPAVIAIQKDTNVSASFVLDTTPIEILNYEVIVSGNGQAAQVHWTTDVPGTSQVEYGLDEFYDQIVSDGTLKTDHVLTLQGLQSEMLYHFQITSQDQYGNPAITDDLTFSTRSTTGLVSDDFAMCGGLNQGLWQWVDPLNDATYNMPGTALEIQVPSGTEHNVFSTGNDSARIMQLADDKDFVIQVKFDSSLIDNGTMQGVIIEQDDENFMRFDFYKRNEQIVVYSAAFKDLTPGYTNNKVKIANVDGPLYMRITRSGDTWLHEYSFDGLDWVATSSKPFTHIINVKYAGVFAGNFTVSGNVPSHTAIVDYFFNMAAPISRKIVHTLSISAQRGRGLCFSILRRVDITAAKKSNCRRLLITVGSLPDGMAT